MNIARGPINRPILTTVIFLIIIILGGISFNRLSIDLMPEIEYPTISVVTNYSNVGPQEIEESITRPIEEALASGTGRRGNYFNFDRRAKCRSGIIRMGYGFGCCH